MSPAAVTLAGAAGLFAGTNVDDMIILALLHASRRAHGWPRTWQIWVGQATGVAVLVLVSLLAALGLRLVPAGWLWLLGLVPLGLGLYRLAALVRSRLRRAAGPVPGSPVPVAVRLPGIIALTVAGGGDNVAAYTPVFRAAGPGATALIIAVFAAGVAVWCLAGSWLVAHERVSAAVRRGGDWLVPVVFVAIGLYVLRTTGAPGT